MLNIKAYRASYLLYLKAVSALILFISAHHAYANHKLINDIIYQNTVMNYGEKAGDKVVFWQSMLAASTQYSEREKLEHINSFFIQNVSYDLDRNNFGITDYWAPLNETLSRGVGDCEDFAIAKYFSLRIAGIPNEKLKIMYVKAAVPGNAGKLQSHMVLGYFSKEGADPLILDSLHPTIKRMSERKDLVSVYSFNSDYLWIGESEYDINGAVNIRLSKWQKILEQSSKLGIYRG